MSILAELDRISMGAMAMAEMSVVDDAQVLGTAHCYVTAVVMSWSSLTTTFVPFCLEAAWAISEGLDLRCEWYEQGVVGTPEWAYWMG